MEDLLERRDPSLEHALGLLMRVRHEAEQRSLSLAAAVVDSAGQLVVGQRTDGAALGAMQLAVGKAFTAVLWGVPSGDFMRSTQPGGDDWGFNVTDRRIVVYAGGVPLFADGRLVGVVGASGGTAEEDEACVSAAAKAAGFEVSGPVRFREVVGVERLKEPDCGVLSLRIDSPPPTSI